MDTLFFDEKVEEIRYMGDDILQIYQNSQLLWEKKENKIEGENKNG